jgi:Lon protease-like protein
MPQALTLTSLPLFPLSTVLYPGGLLPLQIFEVRYLDMVGKAYKAGAPFGIVSLTQGAEVQRIDSTPEAPQPPTGGAYAKEVFHTVGTLATITEFAAPQAGLLVIQCLGTQRFEIDRREKLKHGLWVADVTCLPDDTRVLIPTDLQAGADALAKVIVGLQSRSGASGPVPLQTPYQLQDCGWVANRWCELLPLPPALKQRMMALDNPLVRLELVNDLLGKMQII